MKAPLKVGDRVRVYGSMRDEHGCLCSLRGNKATVIRTLFYEDEITVKEDSLDWSYYVHPKQCRRLIKKPKKPLREIWVNYEGDYFYSASLSKHEALTAASNPIITECVHFVEKREKK